MADKQEMLMNDTPQQSEITVETLEQLKAVDLKSVDRDSLVDIRDVKIDMDLPREERALNFIKQIKNPYCYKHGKYTVKVSFSDSEYSLQDRLAAYIQMKL